MKLIKFEPSNGIGRQKYFYECAKCGDTKIKLQRKDEKTDLCFKCYSKLPVVIANHELKNSNGYYFKKQTIHICVKCGVSFLTHTSINKSIKCINCSSKNKPKKKKCTSKYIGVSYQKSNKGFKGYWQGKMVDNKCTIFFCKYLDDDIGSDEEKQDLCAINREIFIIENKTTHKRNFTDKELQDIKIKYVKEGML